MGYQQPRNGVAAILFVTGQRNDAFLKSDLAQRVDRNARRAGDRAGVVRKLLSALRGRARFFDRLPLLLRILPYFVVFSVVVCYAFNLTTTKWRFISLPDALNILRAATVLTLALLVLDYIFVAPNVHGTPVRRMSRRVLPRQDHHRSVLVSRGVFPQRLALCLSLFPLYARCVITPGRRMPRRRCWSAAPRMPKSCCAESKAARSSGSGRSACCRRRRPTAGSRSAIFRCWAAIDDIEDVIRRFRAGATSRSRAW